MLQSVFGELKQIQDIKIVDPKYRLNAKCTLKNKTKDIDLSFKIG
jgi:hypothetical protein